jgi:tetratricopeptide (TPR) repeat protein
MADESYQSAVGTGIAQALGEGAHATVNITGFTSEQIATMLRAAGAAQQTRIDELATRLSTGREALLGFFKILQEDDVPVEQLTTKLTLIAQRYVSMLERLAALAPEDADAQRYIDEAREVLRQAASTKDYDRADALLSQAEEAQDFSLQRAEALEREAHDVASQKRLSTAATRAERGELSLTRLDYLQAAQHFKYAASLVAAADPKIRLVYWTHSAGALTTFGDEKGDNAVLAQAISVYRDVLREISLKRFPLFWAMNQNNLGNALQTLGERETGIRRLEEALTAYREALRGFTRERVPLKWAASQNNLGAVLMRLGERESGTRRLEEAVIAFREALKERTREQVPLDWAATQNNLGNVVDALGRRGSGTLRSEEAVTAYREALKERTRERTPLQWAATQNNLGAALQTLGERESLPGRGGDRVSRGSQGKNSRAGAAGVGGHPEQPRYRASYVGGARKRDTVSGGGRGGLSGGPQRKNPGTSSAGVG